MNVPQAALEDLQTRLARTRLPEKETPDDWSQGVPLAYMQEILDYWRSDYDWCRAEAALNRFPQFRTGLDGLDIVVGHGAFASGLLVVNGVDWSTYTSQIRTAYQDSVFWGDLPFTFWDTFAEPEPRFVPWSGIP